MILIFYIRGSVGWTYSVYSYGLFTNDNLTNPIPMGFETYTMIQLAEVIPFKFGYEITKHLISTLLMLKLFFKPIVNTIITTQQMVFFPEMIGDEAKIYIRVARGETDVKITFSSKI
jgi:hypothetical protein